MHPPDHGLLGRVLVTGAGGFVGRRLVAALHESGCEVRALVRSDAPLTPGVTVVRGNLRDAAEMSAALDGIETIFHLAGKVHDVAEQSDSGAHQSATVDGTRQLLAAAGPGVRRVIFVSSLAVFGHTAGEEVRDDDSACAPDTPYGRAKLEAERLVLAFGASTGAHVACIRPAAIYGAGCKGNLPRMMRLIERGWFPRPPRGGRRSVVHVADVVQALRLAAGDPAANGRCYTVTDETPLSAREMFDLLATGFGRTVPRWSVPPGVLRVAAGAGDLAGRLIGRRMPLDSGSLDTLLGAAVFSSRRIMTELAYQPTIDFRSAVPELVAWWLGESSEKGQRAKGTLSP